MPGHLEQRRKGRPLSFIEFQKKSNNFALHFAGRPGKHLIGDTYRKNTAFKKCLAESSEFAVLAEELYDYDFSAFDVDSNTKSTIPRPVDPQMTRKLYKAYLLMRTYAEKDRGLFE